MQQRWCGLAHAHARLRGTQGAWTALICAAREGHAELTRLLLASGADVAAKSSVRVPL